MSAVGWTKRSSKTNRVSYTQFINEMGRQSQSVERPSRIPLRSSSQSGRERVFQNQPKQRSKSQIPSGVSETPLSHGKFTPSQYGFKITSGASSTTSNKKPTSYKDPRNLQDKEFLKEATYLVQSYFQEKCPSILINNSEVKPMTIKMFIAMVNHLFDVLGILDKGIEPVKFSVTSYEKELPFWMKKLEYPGLITKAWLQTVNVPQYWPHVVGLLSWLVKLCTVCSMYNMEEQTNFSDEYLSQKWAIFFFEKSMKAFRYYNEGKEELLKELCQEVIQKFQEVNGVSESSVKQIEDEIAELKQKIEDPTLLADKDAYDELEQQLRVLDAQQQKLVDDMEKKEIYIEELKVKKSKSEKKCAVLEYEIEETKREIARLKATISSQATSVEDIVEIQKKTEYLDKEIKYLKKECEDYSQLISRYEEEAAGLKDKILQMSHAFNRSIIQLEQIVPELRMFHIHVDLESEDVVDRMEEMLKSIESLKNSYTEKHQQLKDEVLESRKMTDDKMKRFEDLQRAIREQEAKNEAKRKEIADVEAAFNEESRLLKEEAASVKEKTRIIQNKIKEINDFKENKKNSELRLESLNKTLEEREQYWSEFWNEVEKKWNVIPATLEFLVETVEKQNKDLAEALDKDKKKKMQNLEEKTAAEEALSKI